MSSEFRTQASSNPFQSSQSGAPAPQRNSFIWIIGIGLLASICLCGGPCVGLVGFGVYQAVGQRDDVEHVIDASLQDIEPGRTDQVLTRISKRALDHDVITREQVENLARNPAFQSYKSARVTGINVSTAFNSNSKMPQGTVANVSGTVEYDDGGTGSFRATLEKENGEWRLYSLQVNRSGTGKTGEELSPEAN